MQFPSVGVVVDLPGLKHLLPLTDPVKACQIDGGSGRAVVELPALGFAWLPREGVPGTTALSARMKLADKNGVRNEFLDAEVDPTTGGLRSLRDARLRVGRIGQRLTFNPGCKVVCTDVRVTSTGPALGEVVTEGKIVDPHDQVLATFRQRFQAWVGRPMLDLRLEINPVKPPEGYPWHAYYGCRFAWADEKAPLVRGCNGVGYQTSHSRPETPDYLELRSGPGQNVVIFPGGLPFHQRQGARMLDVILLPEGETCRTFDLGLALDRPAPLQTALGLGDPRAPGRHGAGTAPRWRQWLAVPLRQPQPAADDPAPCGRWRRRRGGAFPGNRRPGRSGRGCGLRPRPQTSPVAGRPRHRPARPAPQGRRCPVGRDAQ